MGRPAARRIRTFTKLTPLVWFVILAVATAGLALGLPPDPQALQLLHISSWTYRVAVLVLLIPYGVIWYAAFYAFDKMRDYSRAIKGFDDGKAFRYITAGMGVLAFGLILPTTISLILHNIAMHHESFRPASVIITNYLGIVPEIVAFLLINSGSHLLAILGKRRLGVNGIRALALVFITIAAIFTYLVTHYQAAHNNVYYLNTPLLITTFVVPNLFGWFMGLLSAYEFGQYATHVAGSVYRQVLRQFSYGIVVVLAGSVAIQFVANTFAARVSNSLGSIVILEYGLLAIVAIGLTLMALGAKKLQMIEEA